MAVSNEISTLTDDELHAATIDVARREQEMTLVTIRHLQEVSKRRLFAKRGYSSIFDYAVKALGFSEPAAAERVQAMRLVHAVPEVVEKLERGELTLSSAAAVQRFIRKEEKLVDQRLAPEEKRQLVAEISGQSVREAARTLLSLSRAPEAHAFKEQERPVTSTRTELRLFARPELMSEIGRARELKGDLSLEEIFGAALAVYLDRIDPMRKPEVRKVTTRAPGSADATISTRTSESVPKPGARPPSRYVPAPLVRLVHARSGGRCEWADRKTGRRCESRHRLQIDHRKPLALGGAASADNLRHLCPAHNSLAAFNVFGMVKMGRYLRV